MAVEFSALPSDFQSMYGEGLQLAGGSLLSRAAKTALKIGDAASLVVPEIAPAVQAAHIVKSALDGAGKKPRRAPVRRAPVRGKGFKSIAKKTVKAAKKAAPIVKKATKIGLNLASEFGTDDQKAQAANAKRAMEIIEGSGHPGHALRKKLIAHHYKA